MNPSAMPVWRADVLGAGFACTDIPLGEDDEGPLVATLVRALAPQQAQHWHPFRSKPASELTGVAVLYVHGWSDYFFQRQLAEFFNSRGADFYALDLRKYGRSLRPGQTPGYITDLREYDAEIAAAIAIVQDAQKSAAGGEKPRLLLCGHSTGGLVLSLWAARHPGVAQGLVLNSPWLELQLSSAVRRAIAPMVNMRSLFSPHDVALPQIDLGFYARAQQLCNTAEEMAAINPQWRPNPAVEIRVAWLRAVLDGHAAIDAGIEVGAPVFVLLSARSHFALNWQPEMARADTVLEVDNVARAALKLGALVTVARVDGALHDVFLSQPQVRALAYKQLANWLRGWQATTNTS